MSSWTIIVRFITSTILFLFWNASLVYFAFASNILVITLLCVFLDLLLYLLLGIVDPHIVFTYRPLSNFCYHSCHPSGVFPIDSETAFVPKYPLIFKAVILSGLKSYIYTSLPRFFFNKRSFWTHFGRLINTYSFLSLFCFPLLLTISPRCLWILELVVYNYFMFVYSFLCLHLSLLTLFFSSGSSIYKNYFVSLLLPIITWIK